MPQGVQVQALLPAPRQKKPTALRFRRGGESCVFVGSFFLSKSEVSRGDLRFGYGERFGFELPWYNSVIDHSARQENGDRFGGRRFSVCAPASNRSTEDRLRRRRAFETQMIDWNQHGFP